VFKTKKFTLLAIVFSICLVFYVRSNTGLGVAIVQERILAAGTFTATLGGYTIAKTEDVINACGDADIRNALSNAQTAAKQKDLDNSLWSYGRSHIKDYCKDSNNSHVKDYAIANAAVLVGPFFFAVLSILCCIFQLIWVLTFSYCKPDDPKKGCCRSKCCQKTACWSTIILPLFVFTFTIGWIASMGTMINSLEDTKCGVTQILNDISNGVNHKSADGNYSQYSGMKGYSYIFN